MGGMTRRWFLRAIGALTGALGVSGAGVAAISKAQPRSPRLFEWEWDLFDYGLWMGVCASLVGPDGIKYRHSVRVPVRFSKASRGPVTHDQLPIAYAEEFKEAQEAIVLWAMNAERRWAA